MIKVVVDSDIPYIKGVLEPFASVEYKKGKDISRSDAMNSDAFIIRTRTKCNEQMLNGGRVRFIASATIGRDHVDEEFCERAGIRFTNAAGCNAWGVVQYVYTAIFHIASGRCATLPANQIIPRWLGRSGDLKGVTIGIIGAGNVGERLASVAENFGLRVLRCDPPLKALLMKNHNLFDGDPLRNGISESDYHTLDEVLTRSDIVTLHVPLNGETFGMADTSFFASMKDGALFINSSRGEVVDEDALIKAIITGKVDNAVIDVWRGEPEINRNLLGISTIATPHIAGYSLEGKINATTMSVRSFAEYFGIEGLKNFSIGTESLSSSFVDGLRLINDSCSSVENDSCTDSIARALESLFPIGEDNLKLRRDPSKFEELRSEYNYRREIPSEVFHFIANLL